MAESQKNPVGTTEIYSLVCPVTNTIRYIGKAKNSEKRLKSHIRDSKRRNTPLYLWIRELIQSGKIPVMKVISIADDWQSEEIRQIQIHKEMGCDLLNVAKGGNQPYCSKEQLAINGSNTFNKIRNERLFELKRRMGMSLTWLKESGLIEKHNSILSRLQSKGYFTQRSLI